MKFKEWWARFQVDYSCLTSKLDKAGCLDGAKHASMAAWTASGETYLKEFHDVISKALS